MESQVLERKTGQKSKVGIIDCDIHPYFKGGNDLDRFLPKRWIDHRKMFGTHVKRATGTWSPSPHGQPREPAGRDSAQAAHAGVRPRLLRKQHLDHYNIETGVLQPLSSAGSLRNREFSAAMCRAMNMGSSRTGRSRSRASNPRS